MVAKTDIRSLGRATQLKVMDPIWDSLREEARSPPEVIRCWRHFFTRPCSTTGRSEGCVIHRICERLDHPDLQADPAAPDLRWRCWRIGRSGARSCASTSRPSTTAIPPACASWKPCSISRASTRCRPTASRTGCCNRGRRDFALYLQSRSSSVFQTDINPAARIGKGIFLDHATGLVVGETAVIGDNVSILHGVTLGGTGKEGADRHPKIASGVLIGAGAKILGNIEIGHCSRVAAGSVVLKAVPPKTTVAGVPAKVVGEAGCSEPSRIMDQVIGADI